MVLPNSFMLSLYSPEYGSVPMHRNHRCMGMLFYWQRMRDSNPRKRSQSPVCYRYTNPLSQAQYYYTHLLEKVKHFFPVHEKIFIPGKTSLPGIGFLYSPSLLKTARKVLKIIFQSTQKLRSWIYFKSRAIQSSKLISLRLG